MKNFLLNSLILLFTTAIVILAGEYALRFMMPLYKNKESPDLFLMSLAQQKMFTKDREIGFKPVLGKYLYNEYGTLRNDYSSKKNPDAKRLLFVGDSVTARGKIINALKRYYGNENFEYWNAGVEAYNIIQEIKFFYRYNYKIYPDHVILTFHINDFEVTPILFTDSANNLVLYTGNKKWPYLNINAYLFRHSYLYRSLLGRFIIILNKQLVNEIPIEEMKQTLFRFQEVLKKNKIDFSVILFPLLCPLDKWPQNYIRAREQSLAILRDLHIRHFDLYPALEKAFIERIPCHETPFDVWHPSDQVSDIFAEFLINKRLLDCG